MKFDPQSRSIVGRLIRLSALAPVVDGVSSTIEPTVLRNGDAWEIGWGLEAPSPGASAALSLEPVRLPDGRAGLELRMRIEGLSPDAPLSRFGFRIGAVGNLRAYLRSGYHSWDGTVYVSPTMPAGDEEPAENLTRGYAVTQLLPRGGEGGMVLGCLRHDRFQHEFRFDREADGTSLTVEALWDLIPHDGTVASEAFLLFDHEEVEEGLRLWARAVAAASPCPPRTRTPRITGWCSWYNLYAAIDEATIREHLVAARDAAREDSLPMRIFQIDDGFTPEMGDWLDVKPTFPGGMKPLLNEIRDAGFVPGLWIAPFLVGNRSRLFRDHPDWVLRERTTGAPIPAMTFYGEFRWHKRSEEYYILDVTHPDAERSIREVFRTWRHDWGCGYFKTDFMHHGSTHGPDHAVRHEPGLTRIGFWMRMARLIREEIGDAVWLGCGSPLWAPVGLVDGMRIGRDMGVSWAGERPAGSLLRDQIARNFAHGILWQADPDCILLRDRFHAFTDREVEALALLSGLTGGVTMTSDHLGELSPERRALWRFVLGDGELASCRFPFLGAASADPIIVAVRPPGANAAGLLLAFNTSDAPVARTIDLAAAGVARIGAAALWPHGPEEPVVFGNLQVLLPPHEAKLFTLEGRP